MAKSGMTFIKTAIPSTTNPLAGLAQTAGALDPSLFVRGTDKYHRIKKQYLPALGYTHKDGHWFDGAGNKLTDAQIQTALRGIPAGTQPGGAAPAAGGYNHTPLNVNVAAMPQSGFVPGTRAQDWLSQAFARPYMEGWGGSAAPVAPVGGNGGGQGGAGAGNGTPATGPIPTGGGGGGTGLGGNMGGSTGMGGFGSNVGNLPGTVGSGWGSGTGTFSGGQNGAGAPIGMPQDPTNPSVLGTLASSGSLSQAFLQMLANQGVSWAQSALAAQGNNGATNPATGYGTFTGQPMQPSGGSWSGGTSGMTFVPTTGPTTPGLTPSNYDISVPWNTSAVDALPAPHLGEGGGQGGGGAGGGSYGSGSGGGWGAGSNSINTFGNNPFASSTTNFGSLLGWLSGGGGGGSVFNYAVK